VFIHFHAHRAQVVALEQIYVTVNTDDKSESKAIAIEIRRGASKQVVWLKIEAD